MYNPFDVIKTHKCMKCIHAELCTQYICGANLDLAAADCKHFKLRKFGAQVNIRKM